MNAAELFKKHSHSTYIESEEGFYRVMMLAGFTAALQEATAQARREALEEAAAICDKFDDDAMAKMQQAGNPLQGMKANGCRKCGLAIRAIAAQPKEAS